MTSNDWKKAWIRVLKNPCSEKFFHEGYIADIDRQHKKFNLCDWSSKIHIIKEHLNVCKIHFSPDVIKQAHDIVCHVEMGRQFLLTTHQGKFYEVLYLMKILKNVSMMVRK